MIISGLNALRGYMHGDGAIVLPEIELLLFAMGILIMGRWFAWQERYWTAGLALAGTCFSGLTLWMLRGQIEERGDLSGFHGGLVVDAFFLFFTALILIATAFVILLSMRFSVVAREHQGRAYALLLFASAALLLMVSGTDLLVVFLAVECAALSCYFLCSLPRNTGKPHPTTLNYVLASALGSAFLAYGFSLVYAATAALNFSQSGSMLAHRSSFAQAVALSRQPGARGEQMYRLLQERMPEALHWHPWMIKALPLAGFMMIVVALLVKMGALSVFRDEGTWGGKVPAVLRAYLGSAFFAATMALLLRLSLTIFGDLLPAWSYVVEVLSCAAVLWGIAATYRARNIRRMVTASLLAHAGYLFMGLVAANERSLTGINFYLFTNLFAIVGTFAILMLVAPGETDDPDADDVAGLARRSGLAASLLTIFLFSLAGIPPAAGFLGRYFIVRALVETGHGSLAWFAGLSSLALAYFYLRAIVLVWRGTKVERYALNLDGLVVAMLAACLFVSLAAGLYAEPFTRLARYALGQ